MVRILLIVLLCGCTVDSKVLYEVDADITVTDCDEIFELEEGTPCMGPIDCRRIDPTDPAQCCREFAICPEGGGVLIKGPICDGCERCEDDLGCEYGASICEDGMCSAGCPGTGICAQPECDPGLVRLTRNGCETCTCAPPNLCEEDPVECGELEVCLDNEACASGCVSGDPGCCTRSCTPVDMPCPLPGKYGCPMECPPELNCDFCYASECECREGEWTCTPACGWVIAECFFP